MTHTVPHGSEGSQKETAATRAAMGGTPQPFACGTMPRTPRLRWFQYRLRTLLAIVSLWAVACSWIAVQRRQARIERQAALEIEQLGGEVFWRRAAPWLQQSIPGVSMFERVVEVDMRRVQATDAALEHVKALSALDSLSFDGSGVADNDLRKLSELTSFRGHLSLIDTKLTDAGLKHLRELTRLYALYLSGTQVTDAGLEDLKGLSRLELLDLVNTKITDAATAKLRCLRRLRRLDLRRTQVTDTGADELREALPACEVYH
jgi:hypothetical protein